MVWRYFGAFPKAVLALSLFRVLEQYLELRFCKAFPSVALGKSADPLKPKRERPPPFSLFAKTARREADLRHF